jgi:diguanylate cyclase (GGDEF)-like protein
MRLTGMSVSTAPQLRLRAWPRRRIWVLLLGAFALIFALDRTTAAAPVQHLYYLPITFAALRFGSRGGMASALLAVLLYHLAKPHMLPFHSGQSDLLQIAAFVAVGLGVGRLAGDARQLHALAMTDDLTGLHNLRSFELTLTAMVRTARRDRAPLSLLVLDVDRLKSLNDVHGHLIGAEAVRTVGRLISTVVSPRAAACRYGGDEFVVALPDSSESQATEVAEHLRRAVNAAAPALAGVDFPSATLSISVGLACRRFEQRDGGPTSDIEAGEALFRAADAALYAAKNGGRNRVRTAWD